MSDIHNCVVCKNKSNTSETGTFGNCQFMCRHGTRCTYRVLFQCNGCKKGICRGHHNALDRVTSLCADCRIKNRPTCHYYGCKAFQISAYGIKCFKCQSWVCPDHEASFQIHDGSPICDECMCPDIPNSK